jgi:hypothetical protein
MDCHGAERTFGWPFFSTESHDFIEASGVARLHTKRADGDVTGSHAQFLATCRTKPRVRREKIVRGSIRAKRMIVDVFLTSPVPARRIADDGTPFVKALRPAASMMGAESVAGPGLRGNW